MDHYKEQKFRFFLIWNFVRKGNKIKLYTLYRLFPKYFRPGRAIMWSDLVKRAKIAELVKEKEGYFYKKI